MASAHRLSVHLEFSVEECLELNMAELRKLIMTYAYVYVHVDVYHYLCFETHRMHLKEYHLKPIKGPGSSASLSFSLARWCWWLSNLVVWCGALTSCC